MLAGNSLTGSMPPEIGNMKNLTWLEIYSNDIEGKIPVSPGLDSLPAIQHFHFTNNSLSGPIPQEIGNISSLQHLLLDSNNLSGKLPQELSKLKNLTVMRVGNNHFSGGIPPGYNKIASLVEMTAFNAGLTGVIPSFDGLLNMQKLDLSSNKFSGEIPKGIGKTMPLLQTLNLHNCSLSGQLDPTISSMSNLQALFFQENQLSGMVPETYSNFPSLLLLDLESNNLTGNIPSSIVNSSQIQAQLSGNPVCSSPIYNNSPLCSQNTTESTGYSALSYCSTVSCIDSLSVSPVYWKSSLACVCGSLLNVTLLLTGATFVRFTESLAENVQSSVCQQLGLPSSSQCLLKSAFNVGDNMQIVLQFFSEVGQNSLSTTEERNITTSFGVRKISLGDHISSYIVLDYSTPSFQVGSVTTGLSSGAMAGIVLASIFVSLLLLLLLGFAIMRFRNKKIRRKWMLATSPANVDADWKQTRVFSLAELSTSTERFSDACQIGSGGFGKVYRGVIRDGTVVAIKRSSDQSTQATTAFLTEIRLLSQVHHKNVVTLLGHCADTGEQILVYEYISGGNIRDHLSGKIGPCLTWTERLLIASGIAEGVAYLHNFVSPPIIHRDIKSTNVLLDDNLVPKLADFGLGKISVTTEQSQISTQVKGTLGYLDPEYYRTQRLSAKSDVFSFGVLLLEIITGQPPVTNEGHILTRVKNTLKQIENIAKLADPNMGYFYQDAFADVLCIALQCLRDRGAERPSMNRVVADIETIQEHQYDK